MTMLVLFLIAAVIVSPWGIVTVRRVLAERRARELARAGSPSGAEPAATQEGGDVDGASTAPPGIDVADALAAMRAEVDRYGPGDEFCLELPPDVTLGGRPADAALVSRLVADDLRRSGIEVIDVVGGVGAALRCRRP